MDKYIPFMSVDELIENGIHTREDITDTNVKNSGFISVQDALDAVEESRRLNHHKNAKEACAHEYEHRHFLKILMDIQPADVVPVVRCGQCGYWHDNDGDYGYCYAKDGQGFGHAWRKNDFCSYGERKGIV